MAVTITYLEMTSRDELRPKPLDDPRFTIQEVRDRQWELNRSFYDQVGDPWNWHDKRIWSDDAWRAYVARDSLRTFVASYDRALAGYFELSHDAETGVEIAYLGLLPTFVGKGLGGALVTSALEEAWRMEPRRVWLHTDRKSVV